MPSCDANTQNVHVSGKFAVHGTYGHLPSITYGSLDFYSIISIIYVVLTLIWLFACYIYSHDIMSVQYTIIVSPSAAPSPLDRPPLLHH